MELWSLLLVFLLNWNFLGYGLVIFFVGILVFVIIWNLERVRGVGVSGVIIEDIVESLDLLGNDFIRFMGKKWYLKFCELFKWKLKI